MVESVPFTRNMDSDQKDKANRPFLPQFVAFGVQVAIHRSVVLLLVWWSEFNSSYLNFAALCFRGRYIWVIQKNASAVQNKYYSVFVPRNYTIHTVKLHKHARKSADYRRTCSRQVSKHYALYDLFHLSQT